MYPYVISTPGKFHPSNSSLSLSLSFFESFSFIFSLSFFPKVLESTPFFTFSFSDGGPGAVEGGGAGGVLVGDCRMVLATLGGGKGSSVSKSSASFGLSGGGGGGKATLPSGPRTGVLDVIGFLLSVTRIDD